MRMEKILRLRKEGICLTPDAETSDQNPILQSTSWLGHELGDSELWQSTHEAVRCHAAFKIGAAWGFLNHAKQTHLLGT